MRQYQPEPQPPCLRQHVSQVNRQPHHVLELVGVQPRRPPLLLRHPDAGKRRLPHAGHQQATHELRRLVPQDALAQRHEHDPPLTEHVSQVEPLTLAE